MITTSYSESTETDERILVCLYYGPNSELLIRRGWKLATALRAPLTLLTVDPTDDNRFSEAREKNMAFWNSMAETLQADLIVAKSDSRNVAVVIAENAKERRITQIIIGQSARTKWEEIAKGSIINQLLHLIKEVDIHIVSVQREIQKQYEDYERGVKACLVREGNRFELRLDSLVPDSVEGVFYRSVHTDFNNGVFKVDDGGLKYRICEGIASCEISKEEL
ncbi:universal stress protein [Cohnella phaseoli]|uniref:Universal stress protein family protein n=1 Tax=Cohnella phaseoli TaxID=456490 RepID=A0A3D9KU71_9BACL|nr:universal stress protein [Cohnella phaseoli]RED89215.1 universal stress protein family protein [Cohnella phaseoli]